MGSDVTIGSNSKVVGRRVQIGSGTTIGDDVTIKGDEVFIGRKCRIDDRVMASWRGGNSRLFSVGDCC